MTIAHGKSVADPRGAFTTATADRLFETKHLVLASADADEVVESCTRALRPHNLLIRSRRGKLGTRLHHMPIGPFSINRLHYGADVNVAPAVPEEDNFLITLPLGGKARFAYGPRSVDVEPGKGAVVGPYSPFQFDIDAAFDQVILRFDRRRVESIGASLVGVDRPLAIHFDLALGDMPDFWYGLLDAAVGMSVSGSTRSHPLLLAHLEELIIGSLLLAQPSSVTDAIAAAARRPTSGQVRKAMDYMREHIAEPLRLTDVARRCGTSLRSLQIGFRRDLGVAPSRWLRMQRLDCAHAALAAAQPGSVSVTDVAFAWGFFHLGEFSAHFRMRFGRTPSSVLANR